MFLFFVSSTLGVAGDGATFEKKIQGSWEVEKAPNRLLTRLVVTKDVTQEQWKEVMGANPSHFKGEKNLPLEWITWDECQEFVKKLREKDKQPYRLPTEAEFGV